MKSIVKYSYLLLAAMVFSACNDALDDELFDKTVVFTKNGFQDIHIDYVNNGEVITNLPISVSGTSANMQDVNVTVLLDEDTLNTYNFERFRNQTALYYRLLPAASYQLGSSNVTIASGQESTILPIRLDVQQIDKFNDYVLPLRIGQNSAYTIGPSKYSKVLMRILFQNYFSGDYVVSGRLRDLTFNSEISLTSRTLKVVDERTCYFYAGTIDANSTLADKEKFIIKVHTDPETGEASLTALDPAIELEQRHAKIEQSTEQDPLNQNIEITTVKLTLTYRYKDISNTVDPPTMEFDGSMTLVKTRDISVWNK